MSANYQVDGNIFREITGNWLCASFNESLIKARRIETDSTGNKIERYLLNDGRMFIRALTGQQASNVVEESKYRTPAHRVLPGFGANPSLSQDS